VQLILTTDLVVFHAIRSWIIIFFTAFFISFAGISQTNKVQKTITSPGLYNTFQWSQNQPFFLCPQVFGTIKKTYLEVRYNYEYLNTGSIYTGYGFSKENKKWGKFSVTPILGLYLGQRNGLAPGYNLRYVVGNFVVASEGQYTFDFNDQFQNYFWNWANALYSVHKNIALGTSVQISAFYRGDFIPQVSPIIRFQHKWLGIDLYGYNLWENEPIYAVGLEIVLN
jgi:hypothetical protein